MSSKKQRADLVYLIYFSDQFRLMITQTSSGSITRKSFKELTLYLMIKTKSRSGKGVNSQKHPQNMRAGYDYNPALQNLQCFILGLTDLKILTLLCAAH